MPTNKQTAAGRFNPLNHGIDPKQQVMFGETEDDLANLAAEYHQHYHPSNPTERLLVDTLIDNEWRLRRLRRVEAELWYYESDRLLDKMKPDSEVSAGETFAAGAKSFIHLQRVIESCERNFHRALKALQRLKAEPPDKAETTTEQPTPISARPAPLRQFPQAPVPAVGRPLPDAPVNPSGAPDTS